MNTLRRRRLDQRQQLVDWRRQYLAYVGVDGDLAATVAADLRWDLHALLQLLERGCPPHLARASAHPSTRGTARDTTDRRRRRRARRS